MRCGAARSMVTRSDERLRGAGLIPFGIPEPPRRFQAAQRRVALRGDAPRRDVVRRDAPRGGATIITPPAFGYLPKPAPKS